MELTHQLAVDHWFNVLKDAGYTASLPVENKNGISRSIAFSLSVETAASLARAGKGQAVSLCVLTMAAWLVLLKRYGIPAPLLVTPPIQSGEMEQEKGNLYFRFISNPAPCFRDVISDITAQFKKASKNRAYDPAQLSQMLEANDAGRACTLGFVFEAVTESFFINNDTDLALSADGEGRYVLSYTEGIFPQHLINSIPAHFDNLLSALLVRPDAEIHELVFLPSKEIGLLMNAAGERRAIAAGDLLHRCFEDTAALYPGTMAVSGEGSSFTYKKLNEQATQLAAYLLKEKDIRPGQTVALIAEHDTWAIICILAVLKAGCAYLPVDPQYPEERVQLMLNDANAVLLISCRELTENTIPVLDIKAIPALLANCAPAEITVNVHPDTVAYFIFTSGSTGKPKGVPVTHRQACHLVKTLAGLFEFGQGLKFIINASFSFDASVKEIFLPLFTGGTLYTYADFRNIGELVKYLCNNGIEVMHGSPLFWQEVLYALQENGLHAALRYISSGGDVLSASLAGRMRQQFADAFFVNLYGPTETCINATYHIVNKDAVDVMPIGRPLPGYRAFVLDGEGRLLPSGISGELCIAGAGVTGRYLNNDAATAKAFVRYAINGDSLVYRTGDKARWDAGGELEFLGRMDSQLKIRGYRIEPDEVRLALEADALVEKAYVTPFKEDDGTIALVAYIHSDAGLDTIKRNLATKIPAYMLPGLWIPVKQFYKNSAGKIDATRLPKPGEYNERDLIAAATETEARLIAIWEKLFPKKKFGALDHFFDRGGHSLNALRLLTAIIREMRVPAELKDIFKFPVLRDMAAHIDRIAGKEIEVIGKALPAGRYPLSPAQQRLWILHQFEEGKAPYNISAGFVISGSFDENALIGALQLIVERYEILRTLFTGENREPGMIILPVSEFQPVVERTDLQNEPEALAVAQSLAKEETVKPFDLAAAPPWKLHLYRLNNEETAGVFIFHHIISDGWSMDVFTGALLQAYKMMLLKEQPALPALEIQYKDYAAWMHTSGKLLQSRQYWIDRFSDELPLTDIPADYPRPAIRSYAGKAIYTNVSNTFTEKLAQFCNANHVTAFVVWFAAFRTLLYRYTGQEDHIIGVPVAGREMPGLEEQIGFFVNTLPVRTKGNGDEHFAGLVQRIGKEMLDHYQHQYYPFDRLVDELKLQRDTSRSPLFDILFGALPVPDLFSENELPSGAIRPFSIDTVTSKYDVFINILEKGSGFTIYTEYDTALFTEERITRMIAHYLHLLDDALSNPQQPLHALQMIPVEEQNRITRSFNAKKALFPVHASLYGLFNKTVSEYPEQIAVKEENGTWTYARLSAAIDRLAGSLILKGVQPGAPVALLMERTAWLQISVLAIHKAGAYYVPVDTGLPSERIEYILRDAGVSILLTNLEEKNISGLPSLNIYNPELLVSRSAEHLAPAFPTGGGIAYMIYTSGSTGRPKGVLVEHAQVLNTLFSMQETCPLNHDDVFLLKTNYTFDVSVAELFGWFISGGSMAVLPAGDEKDPQAILEAIKEYGVTHINFVPALFSLFFDLVKEDRHIATRLKYIIVAGEAFPAALAGEICAYNWAARIYNFYGPTEASIYATGCSLEKHDSSGPVYIGTPLHNAEAYILGTNNTIVPVGIPGELCIGGPGVSSGYYQNEQLTAERFVHNPFGEGKMYRSGDIARWTADGQIEYLGRIDEQVKIRGYRIETGEIEYVLSQVAGVQQAIVIVKNISPDNPQLVGYITATETFSEEQAMNMLRSKLPVYMVPSTIVVLKEFPLNKSGKIDRKALPNPVWQGASRHEFVAPGGYMQEKVAAIWEQVLGVEKAGAHDNFFAAGGNSLLAIKLNAAVCKEFKTGMSVKEIFLHPTIAGLSKMIDPGKLPVQIPAIVRVTGSEQLPLSFAQERFWMIDKWGRGQAYHIPVVLQLSGPLNTAALQQAFAAVIQRHEPLRTIIKEQRGIPYQVITQAKDWHIAYREYPAGEDEYKQMIAQFIYQPFDLAADCPVRVCIIKKDVLTHTLALVFHHIALDIWSVYLIANELKELYKAYCMQQPHQLQPLDVRYADYAVWQRNYLSGTVLEQKAGYWVNRLQDVTPLQLPEDFTRPAVQQFSGRVMRTVIDAATTAQLKQLSDQYNTTLFVTLLAVCKVLLHRYSGQQDICIGVPVANRMQQETESMAGCFINTVVMRSNVQPGVPFSDLLKELNKVAMEAYEHQDVPFEYVLERLNAGRNDRNPLFNVMFELQDIHLAAELALHGLEIKEEHYEHSTSLFDLSFSLSRNAQTNELLMDVEYSTELFHEETIEQLIKHYTSLLKNIAGLQHEPVGRLPLMDADETNKLLNIFSGNAKEYPDDITVLDLFARQVKLNPAAKAVVFNNVSLTYNELDLQATQLANYLTASGAGKGSLVIVYMERSLNMMVAILGILKAGAAYIPVDPAYPRSRVDHMISDAGASVIITDNTCLPDVEARERTIINLDTDQLLIKNSPQQQPAVIASADPAYVIYTSGSTGLPKGVMIGHDNLLNIVLNWRDHYQLQQMKPVLFSIASVAFDVFTGDWCRTLTNGGTMIIADNRNFDMQDFYSAMEQNGVNIMESTPSVVMSLIRYIESAQLDFSFMKLLIIGSDILPAENYVYLRETYGQKMRIINSYGVTEATIDSSYFEEDITQAGITPIGRPMNNIYYYILDELMNPVPVNVWGELYIGGAGVGKGYLNRESLTSERFLENPFIPGTMMYRTGDKGRWLKNGCVQFAGRNDDQVKIRGFRIETGEIQNVLLQHEAISNAVVTVQHDPLNTQDKYLCAFYTVKPGVEALPVEELRSFLLEKLPVFMLPDYFLCLGKIPLTVNGKVDKKALPFAKEHASPSIAAIEPPAGEIEISLFELWAEVLKTNRFGVTDNFFLIGGNSLKAVNVLSFINEHFMTDIKMKEFIADPVIRSLASVINEFYEEQKLLFSEALDETIRSEGRPA